jgi:hypothetical protein
MGQVTGLSLVLVGAIPNGTTHGNMALTLNGLVHYFTYISDCLFTFMHQQNVFFLLQLFVTFHDLLHLFTPFL